MTLTQILQKIRSVFYTKSEIDSMGGGTSLDETIKSKVNKAGDIVTGDLSIVNGDSSDTRRIVFINKSESDGYLLPSINNYSGIRFCKPNGNQIGEVKMRDCTNERNIGIGITNTDGTKSVEFRLGYDSSSNLISTIGDKNIDVIDSQGNGYIRYTNGLQICYGTVKSSTFPVLINFSKSFGNSVHLVTSANHSGGVTYGTSLNQSSFKFNVSSPTDLIDCRYIAIGYWK